MRHFTARYCLKRDDGADKKLSTTTKVCFSIGKLICWLHAHGHCENSCVCISSVETLDELQDWLTAQNPQVMAELREARRQDLAGEFKAWEPHHVPWPTESK